MAEVWVRLPLGACNQDVGKLGIPRASGARDRWFKSSRPDFCEQQSGVAQSVGRLPVKETSDGSSPSAGAERKFEE